MHSEDLRIYIWFKLVNSGSIAHILWALMPGEWDRHLHFKMFDNLQKKVIVLSESHVLVHELIKGFLLIFHIVLLMASLIFHSQRWRYMPRYLLVYIRLILIWSLFIDISGALALFYFFLFLKIWQILTSLQLF